MKNLLLLNSVFLMLAVLCGCSASGFMAVSIAGNASGGVYNVKSAKEIIHTPLPRLNYMVRDRHTGLYYATQNGIAKSKVNRSGNVVVMQKQSDGTMRILQNAPVNGITPCHLTISPCGKFLYTANYSSGDIAEFRIEKGKLVSPPRLIRHQGSSVTRRQTAPHPHFAGFNPGTGELFVCDLGTDEVVIYDSKLKSVDKLKLAPGAGPRHLAFAPDGKSIYVANELNSTITSFFKTASGWKTVKTVTTRPANPVAKKNFPGAVKITSCGRFFFITNRGDDTLAMFETLENGDFRLIKNVPSQGSYPSDILFCDNEKTVITINLKSGTAAGFKLNKAAADLIPLAGRFSIPRGIGLCE